MNIIVYADDNDVLSNDHQLKLLSQNLVSTIEKLKLGINRTKYRCVVFEKGRHCVLDDKINICDDDFRVVNNYRYRGHIIQKNLLDVLHIELRLH